MAFKHFRDAALKAGKTVELVVVQLPGEPVIAVEHLGETNASWMNDQILKASATTEKRGQAGGKKLTKKAIAEARERNREVLKKHVIRKLVNVRHEDGTLATDKDIPEFVDALPDDVVDTIMLFAVNADNFRDETESDPKELAEK